MNKFIHNNEEYEIVNQTDIIDTKNYDYVEISEWEYIKEIGYNSIKKLTDRGMKQVNMHIMICKETYDQVMETLNDIKTDERLSKLNAIVFLSLKQKGRANKGFTPLTQEEFSTIINKATELGISWGCDSCGANKVLKTYEGKEEYKKILNYVEPCESMCYSYFVNCSGIGFPCSFAEGTDDWKEGIPVYKCDDFVKNIWNHPRSVEFRNRIISCNRNCFLYNV